MIQMISLSEENGIFQFQVEKKIPGSHVKVSDGGYRPSEVGGAMAGS